MAKLTSVPTRTFYDWVPAEKRRMPFSTAYHIARNIFCARLIQRGVCPLADGGACAPCRPYLERTFDFQAAANPAALATYIAKQQAAQAIETFRAQSKNLLSDAGYQDGRPTPEPNPFTEYLNTLE